MTDESGAMGSSPHKKEESRDKSPEAACAAARSAESRDEVPSACTLNTDSEASVASQQGKKEEEDVASESLTVPSTTQTDGKSHVAEAGAAAEGGGGRENASSSSSSSSSSLTLTLQVATLDSGRFSVQANPDLRVSELKRLLVARSGIPASQQRLVTRGRVLADGETLRNLGLVDGATLHLLRNASSVSARNNHRNSAREDPPTPSLGLPLNPSTRGPGGLDDSLMRQMLGNPFMQQILENTDVVSAILESSPELQALREVHPEINQVLSDPQLLRQSIEMMRNPALWREAMRNTDRAMANVEAHAEGFNLLRRFYRGVQEPMHNAAVDVVTGFSRSDGASDKLDWSDAHQAVDGPTEEMPNPWATFTPGDRTGSSSSFSSLLPSSSAPSRRSRVLSEQRGERARNSVLQNSPLVRDTVRNTTVSGEASAGTGRGQVPPALQRGSSDSSEPIAWPSLQSLGMAASTPLENSFSGLNLTGSVTPLQNQASQPPQLQQAYPEQLAALASMGFSNHEECMEALRRAGGNLNRAIDFLLSRTQER